MSSRKPKNDNLRINLIAGGFGIVSLLFLFRLFTIQVLGHSKYKSMATEQYWNYQDIPSRRGNITSSDGYLLATTQNHYLLYVEPKNVSDKTQTVQYLAEYLSKVKAKEEKDIPDLKKSYEERFTSILSSDLFWAILEHNLTPPEKEEIEKQNILGLGFEEEPVRYYPEGTLAAHVLGFVGSNDKGEKQGYFGIEGQLDGDLKGKAGRVVQEKDAIGTPILVGGYKHVDPINGRDVTLSINRSIQFLVERKLKEGVEKYDALSGSVIVMDPFTGDVLALANFPTYDPANYVEEEKETTESVRRKTIERKNSAVADTYEPGSVMKPLTVSAAIDLGKVTPTTTFEDKGPVNYSDYWIDNWDGKHHGVQTIIQLLQKSNNIGAAWVGHVVGSKELYRYLENFGIGSKTGIDLQGEDTGILRDYDTWTDIDLANIAFGQGVSATPLQVLTAFNVMANGGNLVQPRIISKITEKDKEIDIPTKKIRRVISKESSDTLVYMLTEAVSGGESKFYNLTNYKIAGKTGTAQIPVGGKYDPSKTNATFVGFLSTSKRFSMIVRLEQPSSSIYAAETAVPLWMSLADDLTKYFGIPPDDITF